MIMIRSSVVKATVAGFLLGMCFTAVISLFNQIGDVSQPRTVLLQPLHSMVQPVGSESLPISTNRPSKKQYNEFKVGRPSKGEKFYFPISGKDYHQVPNLTTPSDGLTTCPHNLNSTIARRLNCRRRLPNVIGLGVQKCGTAALSFFLESHPNLVHSNPREVHFWSRHTMRGMGWYKEQMHISSKYQLTMEKSPSYWRIPQVPLTIKRWMPPDVKFIVIIRDPVKRAISSYVHLKVTTKDPAVKKDRPPQPGQTPLRYMNTTFESSVIRPNGQIMDYNTVISNGLYARRFRHWLSVFPRNRFFVVDGDEFSKNPLPILKELETFLGLPKYFDEKKLYFNEEKGHYCRRDSKSECLSSQKGRTHPIVSEDVQQRLRNFYHPYNQEMEKLVGQKFSWT